jgi:hypothetical protein
MRFLLLGLLGLLGLTALAAGCYRSTDTPTGAPKPAPVFTTPAPRIEWADQSFLAPQLPAVSTDGTAVLIGLSDNDGGRGNPNYRLEIRDRRDAKLLEHIVLDAEEVESLYDKNGNLSGIEDRVDQANGWIKKQHATRGFVPIPQLETESTGDITTTFRATGHGITLEWQKGRLTILHGGVALVGQATPSSWYAPRRKAGDLVCNNPARLEAAAVSVEHEIAVVTLAFMGNDTCWEPSDAPHVVAW